MIMPVNHTQVPRDHHAPNGERWRLAGKLLMVGVFAVAGARFVMDFHEITGFGVEQYEVPLGYTLARLDAEIEPCGSHSVHVTRLQTSTTSGVDFCMYERINLLYQEVGR